MSEVEDMFEKARKGKLEVKDMDKHELNNAHKDIQREKEERKRFWIHKCRRWGLK